MEKYEKAKLMFKEVVKLIDPKTYPQAARIVWKIPFKYFLDDVTPETYAGLIISDSSFWHWFLKQDNEVLKKDIHLARVIFSAMDDEDKVMTEEDLQNDFYYQHYPRRFT